MQPSEFWGLAIEDWWDEAAFHREKHDRRTGRVDMNALREWTYGESG